MDFAIACPRVSLPEETPVSQKEKLAIAIAKGVSVTDWARANDVPLRTAYRWARDPKVRAAVARSRQRCLDRALGQMSTSVHWAACGIRDLAEKAQSESVKLSALRTIFTNMMSVSEFADLQKRMSNLEEKLDERAHAGDTGQTG